MESINYSVIWWVEGTVMSGMCLSFYFFLWRTRRIRVKKLSPDVKAAHMPSKFLQPEHRKLVDLPPGETGYITYTDVAVDLNGAAFVDENAMLWGKSSFSSIGVRIANGGCLLVLPKRADSKITFTPRRLTSFTSYLAVTEIIESDEPIE